MQSLKSDAASFDLQAASAEPSYRKQVDQLYKRCRFVSESLLQNLMHLDQVVASDKTRPQRKEEVRRIQSLLDACDGISKKLEEQRRMVRESCTV